MYILLSRRFLEGDIMQELHIVVGVSGVGKSTVLKGALEGTKDITWVNYGDLFLKVALGQKIAKDRDELKALKKEKIEEIQRLVWADISGMEGKVIVDTDLIIESSKGFIPGLPYSMIKNLRPENIILIEVPPEEIIRRRNKDKDIRKREEQGAESIRTHLDLDRAMGSAISFHLSCPLVIVDNIALDDAVASMKKALGV
jgi:adenylate kinase